MTVLDASTTFPTTAATSRQVAVVGSDGAVLRRVRQWLSTATDAAGQYTYFPHCWNPQVIRQIADSEGRIRLLDGALDTALPGRDSTVSWYATATETEAVADLLLGVIPPGGTWVGLGPLPLRTARLLADRAACVGVRYVHAPLAQPPSTVPADERPSALAYQHPEDGMREWTFGLLRTVASPVVFMGGLAPHTATA